MKLTAGSVAALAAMCVLTGTAEAAGGLLIVQKTTSGGAPQTQQIQIENKRMRAESSGATGGKQIVMFDSARQVMTLVDPDKKTYTEITRADVERVGSQMTDAMASIPPAQRAQFEGQNRIVSAVFSAKRSSDLFRIPSLAPSRMLQ